MIPRSLMQPQQQCNQLIPYPGTWPCPSSEQAYIPNGYSENIPPPPQCMTKEEVAAANKSLLSDCESESYVPPKKASKNCTCDCNNFIESETGYRQATKCVCAPYKSSHIHFVT